MWKSTPSLVSNDVAERFRADKFKVGRESVTRLRAHSRKHTDPARQLEVEWLRFQF